MRTQEWGEGEGEPIHSGNGCCCVKDSLETSQHWQDFLYSADLHFAEFRKVLDREEPDYAD